MKSIRKTGHVLVAVSMMALQSCSTYGGVLVETEITAENRFNVTRFGQGPENILLLHGIGASKESWEPTFEYFDKTKHTLHVLDLLGHGSPYFLNEMLTPERQAEFVASYLVENKVTDPLVVGHSYGGIVSMILAMDGKTLGIEVKDIVLVNSPIFMTDFPLFVKYYRKDWLSAITNFFTSPSFRVKHSLKHVYTNDEKIKKSIVDMYILNSTDPLRVEGIKNTAKNIDIEKLSPRIEHYKKLQTRIVYIRSADDIVTSPEIINQFDMAFTDGRSITINHCGHNAQEECPELVVKEILREIGG